MKPTPSPYVQRLLDALQQAGCDPAPAGDGWTARCPAHDDHNPSLSIGTGKDGKVLLHCHAGCASADVLQALGLRWPDVMSDAAHTTPSTAPSVGVVLPEPPPIAAPESTIEAARDLMRRGFRVVPVPSGGKNPGFPRWQHLRIDESELDKYFGEHGNVGVLLGEPSDGLVDVDLDSPEALALADQYLPPTGMVLGRESNPRSHRIYRVRNPLKTVQHKHPETDMVVELRSTGVQTIAPGSTHPSGERIGWYADGEPTEIEWNDLVAAVHRLYLAATGQEEESPPLRFQPFPVHVLPGPVGQYVAAAAASIGCDPSYVALPLLSALASAIGNTRRIRLKNTWSEPAVVWTAIVGESGAAKSPAMDLALHAVHECQKELMREHEVQRKAWAIAKEKHDADKAAWKRRRQAKETQVGAAADEEPPPPPECPLCVRLWTSDTTTEALAGLLQENPRGVLMVRDELAGWFNFDRYAGGRGGGDVAKWLEMFSGRPLIVDRKTSETIYVPMASVSIAGGIQPGTLRRALTQEHRENGLAARLLFASPPRLILRWTEDDVSSFVESEMVDVFDRLYALEQEEDVDHGPRPQYATLDPDAKRLWVTFVNEHAEEHLSLVGEEAAAWSKLQGYAARFALVISLVRSVSDPNHSVFGPDVVDAASMRAGIELTRWFAHEAKRVYATLGCDESEASQARLLDWIERKGGTVTVRELQQMGRKAYPTATHAQAALDAFVQKGWGRWEHSAPGAKGGRPSSARFVLARRDGHRAGSCGHATGADPS